MGMMEAHQQLRPAAAGAARAAASAHAAGKTKAQEYLTFRLGAEEYGIDILKVQEIRGYEEPTHIANAPAYLKGVVNLRGTIVPIVDMRMRFGCESVEYNGFTVSIILNLGDRVVGVVVDSVSDVMELPAEAIKPAPELGSVVDAQFITGLGSINERMLILLDIESLILAPSMGLASAQLS